jgi:hypothetical protein
MGPGIAIDTAAVGGWAAGAALGAGGFVLARRPFLKAWGEANAEIEEWIRRAQT